MRCVAPKVATLTMAGLAIVLSTAASGWGQNVGQGNNGRRSGLDLGAMAQQIFNQSDRNQNNLLSRTEFSSAQLLTDNTVAQLGRAGLIGRGTSPVRVQMLAGPLGQGGMLGLQNGLLNVQITNTNRVTLPQFTNYFQNSVARGDAAWRQMYAMNRRTGGRAYPHYGRGYGSSAYRNYGSGRSMPSVMPSSVAQTPATHSSNNPAASASATGPTSSGNTNNAGLIAGLPAGVNILAGGSGMTTVSGGFEQGLNRHHHKTGSTAGTAHGKTGTSTANPNNLSSVHKNALSGGASVSNASSQSARARVTAMAQARSAAAHRAYSTGGGGGGGGYGGGGGAHSMGAYHGGGGGGHGGGGHGGGGHHR